MSTTDVLTLLRRRPFIPFRVITTDGTVCEVRHPELVMAGLSSVIIGYPAPGQPEAFERWDVVSLRHIIRLEPQGELASPAGG
jgi:hypothetical protein